MKKVQLSSVSILLLCCGGQVPPVDPIESVSTATPAESSETATTLAAGSDSPGSDTSPNTSATGTAPSTAVLADCVERYPAATPFDPGWQPSGPGRPGDPLPVFTVDPIVADCSAHAGTNCDVSSYVSMNAAICVAQATMKAAGALYWGGSLDFNPDTRRVEWSVSANSGCCLDVWQFRVDASDGGSTFVSHTDTRQSCTANCAAEPLPARPAAASDGS